MVLLLSACGQQGEPDESASPPDSTAVKLYSIRPDRVVGIARVEPEEKLVTLYPTGSGLIREVYVRLGDTVVRGQVLFELDHDREDAQLARIEAQLREQESGLPVIEADLRKAELQAELAERELARVRQVFDQGAETRQTLDETDYAFRSARQEVASLQARLANARAGLAVIRADLRVARVDSEERRVRAPADGRMLSVDVAAGFLANSNTALGQLAPRSPTTVVTEIDELFADAVQLGQPAYVRRQGAQDTLAVGKVVEVAPALSQKSLFSDAVGALEDRRVREVRIRLTGGADSLLYGSRVEAVISTVK